MADTVKKIDVATFRRRNGVKQAELAEAIGKSRGYISVVETTYGKLTPESIDIILSKWGDDCGLIPYYGRLVQLVYALTEQGYLESFYPGDVERGYLPFSEILGDSVVKSLRYGQIALTDDIADKIVTAFPAVNKGWILTGEGNMLYDNTQVRLDAIEKRLEGIEKKFDVIDENIRKVLLLLEQGSHLQ